MHLIVDIDIGGPTIQGTAGLAEAAQQLRELADEIERNAWPARTEDAQSPISQICRTSKLARW